MLTSLDKGLPALLWSLQTFPNQNEGFEHYFFLTWSIATKFVLIAPRNAGGIWLHHKNEYLGDNFSFFIQIHNISYKE